MFLIMSGAYVGQELESEFGHIPPSFLPLGNRRLFQHQVALAPAEVDVYLSVPESYTISPLDQQWLQQNGVTPICTPDGLSLGASMVAAINISGHSLNTPLHILYGDTLFSQLPVGDDIASVSTAKDSYNWAVLTDDKAHWLKDTEQKLSAESNRIIDGYFKFSQPRELVRCITQSEWNFIEGLNRYHQSIGLTPVDSNGWLDFGHVNTYYRSKAEHTTQRAFNELTITPKWIEKASVKNEKIAAEANWFEQLPYPLRGYIPQYLGSNQEQGKVSYRLEYLHLTALNELFVFAKLPSQVWQQILTGCVDFLSACSKQTVEAGTHANTLDVLFGGKTPARLAEFCRDRNIDINSLWTYQDQTVSLKEVLALSEKHLPTEQMQIGVLHGDFCFSNILYDFRAGKVKTIDPRGITPDGRQTIYGDIRYDLAKLSHSILGLYDWIIAGYYEASLDQQKISLTIEDNGTHRETQQAFIQLVEQEFGITAQNLYAMQIQLFLSMLPLHSDDKRRQDALFANAFRLHQILQRLEQ
ncbi:aminoglycoside phosphotransferase family protein [Vibrio sinaloensis]|uniref:aminoglycoside phosphotransferase family protein n=1 Tax=Photobacterium sp. (strain ATCC 43367) TaxID=379097 RepID=UPI00205F27D1|nr:aminoglycoside phosphotransferase family protein [Vibrio sinaloensis]UPQ88093.1 aminoglycoside phosphotransferase family protein [Vibrio sinaloensis]